MRARVRVVVELIEEPGLGRPIGDRVIATAKAEHEHTVTMHPATDDAVRRAAETAGPIALRRAVSGVIAAAAVEEWTR